MLWKAQHPPRLSGRVQQGTWGGYAVREPQRSAPVTSDSAVGPVGAILDFPYWLQPQTGPGGPSPGLLLAVLA